MNVREKYGKKHTWCSVYGALRETVDIDNQRSILKTCGYWEDRHAGDETDGIRLQILLDVLRDPLLNYKVRDRAAESLDDFDHMISVVDKLKEIYMSVDDGRLKRSLSVDILRKSDDFLYTNQRIMYIYTSHWPGKPFKHVLELTKESINEDGKDVVLKILHKLRDTPFTVPKTKRLVKRVLESELF